MEGMYNFLCQIPLRNIRRLKTEHMLWNGKLNETYQRYTAWTKENELHVLYQL